MLQTSSSQTQFVTALHLKLINSYAVSLIHSFELRLHLPTLLQCTVESPFLVPPRETDIGFELSGSSKK